MYVLTVGVILWYIKLITNWTIIPFIIIMNTIITIATTLCCQSLLFSVFFLSLTVNKIYCVFHCFSICLCPFWDKNHLFQLLHCDVQNFGNVRTACGWCQTLQWGGWSAGGVGEDAGVGTHRTNCPWHTEWVVGNVVIRLGMWTFQTWDFSADRQVPQVIFEISSNPLRKL